MMQLFLEAVDVWLFRDGKPFDARSDHRARSLFPPYPSVMQGVIRSHHLVVKGVDLRDRQAIEATVGTTDKFGDLRLRGPFVAKKEGDKIIRYFPVPADVAPRERGYRPLHPQKTPDGVKVSAPGDLPMLLWPGEGDKPTKKEHGQWQDEATLLNLLKCLNGWEVKGVNSSELFVHENRFGIGRNDERRTTEEGALYEVDFIRPCKDVGLWVQVDGYDGWPDSGVLRIGGEGRAARFTNVAPPLMWPSVDDPLPARFKVYFASPTYFTGGWKPNEGWGKFFEGEVKLQAVALNRYESIGGYDWAAKSDKAQKPACRYVPAGSVYYFQHDGSAKLKQGTITEYGAEIGFGQVIIPETEWKEK
jgi:CRISPR-associated protein Cmr3